MAKCKYCGVDVYGDGNICSNCREKLPLVRTIFKMLEPYKKFAEERKMNNALQNAKSTKIG